MIKQFIGRLLGAAGNGRKPSFGSRREIARDEHGIDVTLVDERALNVVRTLKEAGHEAYIVGGAVRDLLLGLRPKDFDVATSATPEQVKSLFRRAFIIGRRFRIVHVVYGRGREHEVIEVSTFRAYMDNASAEAVAGNERTSRSELAGMHHAVDASGRVLRDNVWGPQDEDATRRDFTVNAMYYDPETQIVVDYHGGLKDARKKLLRMIGDPTARYREDPVRIIRAVRFMAKLHPLGFKLEPKTGAPLSGCLPMLGEVPQSRLFDEMLKLLQTGHALDTVAQLNALGLAQGIYPLLSLVVERAGQPFVRAALEDTDRRVGEGKPVAPSFLLACVLWADVRDNWNRRLAERQHPFPALQDAIDEVFSARIGDVSGRGKLAADMREIWMMQPRFEKRTGSTPFSLVEQPRFRAAFDFMRLRADVGEIDVVLADWWQEFSTASDAQREDMVAEQRQEQQRGKRRVRAARPPVDAAGLLEGDAAPAPRAARAPAHEAHEAPEPSVAEDGGEAPARKRRRRRRKPASDAGDARPMEPGAEPG
ncbi:polynucleotide adenylyltransferase PcnB [Ramlibacter sp. AW1]|uniref:Poly(A) polymerase I n=1 Tax=Ramlibacter aurantiacus TaxID=2801330 RepID=A0A937D6J3_9BURK|nr:polynucleotide adenylyltransferase PcnB [Ramlibacter aurantiacus]MBL0419901.1 polynucleotide adenylyltransferase PcnB [Ramlibacter aurantiacus]